MFLMFIALAILLSLAFWVTYRLKNHRLMWLLVLGLPMLFLPLALMPPRNPIILGLIWLPAAPYLVGSVIMLIVRIVKLIIGSSDPLLKIKLIRPALIILIFTSIFIYHDIVHDKAYLYVIELASQLQSKFDKDGICADSIDDWEKEQGFACEEYYSKSKTFIMGIYYPLYYETSEDRKCFELSIGHGFNMSTVVRGGVGEEISAAYIDEEGSYDISVED